MCEWMKVCNSWMKGMLTVLLLSAPLLGHAASVDCRDADGHAGPQSLPPITGPLTVFDSSALISGRQTTHAEFYIPLAGTVTIELRDLEWPEKLASLSFLLTDAHEVLERVSAPGTLNFELDAPGQFFGFVSAATQGAMKMGLYSVRVSVLAADPDSPAPVPLPAAAWLLLGGLAGIAGFGRKIRGGSRE